jgi:hypothetical protein
MKRVFLVGMLIGVIVTAVCIAGDEITMNAHLKATKNGSTINRSPATLQVDWTGTRFYSVMYSATNAWQSLGEGAVSGHGLCFLENATTNKTIFISFDCGTTTNLTLNSEEYQMFRLTTTYAVTSMAIKCVATGDFVFTVLEN